MCIDRRYPVIYQDLPTDPQCCIERPAPSPTSTPEQDSLPCVLLRVTPSFPQHSVPAESLQPSAHFARARGSFWLGLHRPTRSRYETYAVQKIALVPGLPLVRPFTLFPRPRCYRSSGPRRSIASQRISILVGRQIGHPCVMRLAVWRESTEHLLVRQCRTNTSTLLRIRLWNMPRFLERTLGSRSVTLRAADYEPSTAISSTAPAGIGRHSRQSFYSARQFAGGVHRRPQLIGISTSAFPLKNQRIQNIASEMQRGNERRLRNLPRVRETTLARD